MPSHLVTPVSLERAFVADELHNLQMLLLDVRVELAVALQDLGAVRTDSEL